MYIHLHKLTTTQKTPNSSVGVIDCQSSSLVWERQGLGWKHYITAVLPLPGLILLDGVWSIYHCFTFDLGSHCGYRLSSSIYISQVGRGL